VNKFFLNPDSGSEPGCQIDAEGPIAGLRIGHWVSNGIDDDSHFLVAQQGDAGWSVVTELESVSNPGIGNVFYDWGLGEMREQTLSGHRVVEIHTALHYSDADVFYCEMETGDTFSLTFCVLGDPLATPPVRTYCPLRVPTSWATHRDKEGAEEAPPTPPTPPPVPAPKPQVSDGGAEEEETYEEEQCPDSVPNLPLDQNGELQVQLNQDGTVIVGPAKGYQEYMQLERYLGTHKLW
jgi:hypothetical protein